jgi:threonine/homoserine/homoserine lactone efflux protein
MRAPRSNGDIPVAEPGPLRQIFRDGFIVALFNPKTALFFTAFLPQFMRTDVEPIVQSILLGTLFVAIAAATDTTYA